nr:alpha/beta hydrolase [Salirhabdus sp. Marseille-P4669]
MEMGVCPSIQAFLDKLEAMPKMPMEHIPAAAYRVRANELMQFDQEVVEMKQVENRVLPLDGRDIPVRVYTPLGNQEILPGLVYYHGGGWVIGNLDSHDNVCRFLAKEANCIVVSVDYRLAPEHKFPTAVDDAYDSLKWIADHAEEFKIDPKRIAVGGDSAGGNLAAVTSIKAKEQEGPNIVHQLLLYPATGYKGDPPPSIMENAEGYFLTLEMMQWFSKQYFNEEKDYVNPYASPIHYSDLRNLPSATVLTAEYDPLRDEGRGYAEALKNSGVNVFYKNFNELIHGFANFIGFSPESKRALADGAKNLSKVFRAEVV